MATEVVASARRIIPRPRLTKLLDENPARIKLLVAPAGYGKTTLAQQWLAVPERRDVWYRAGPAAADVAALAAGLAIAASEIIPDAGKRMRERIRAVGNSEEDVDVLAELFAEDVRDWPSDAWLAIDDYHFAMESAASERFMEALTEQTPLQLLITSRRRPAWAATRRIVYGEIQEVGRRILAMSENEASEVLGRYDQTVAGFLEQAAGWPAVIGLAALSRPAPFQGSEPPTALYDYLAEEVVSTRDVAAQRRLATLALARRFDAHLARDLLGQWAEEALEEGLRSGVLEPDAHGMYEVHPLLSEFLETQLRIDREEARSAARNVALCLLESGRVDEAFDLAARFDDTATTELVLASSLDRLLREGRVATITRWLERKPLAYSTAPVVSLADAEKEFRQGQHARALELAAQALESLADSPLRSRALARAGQSALMANRETEALRYFDEARATAKTPTEVREALLGSYLVCSELGLDDAEGHLAALTRIDDASAETSLRIEAARLMQAACTGGIAEAIERALAKRRLIESVSDPLSSTAFLHALANNLILASRYDEAHEIVDALISMASRYRIAMPLPHARLNQALACHGRREYALAHAALTSVRDHIGSSGDTYLEFSVRAIRARILASEQRVDEALEEVTPDVHSLSSRPLLAEYLASKALVCAVAGDQDLAELHAGEAHDAYPTAVTPRVLRACVAAIIACGDPAMLADNARVAWNVAQETGNFDGIVCSYRAWPPLLRHLFRAGAQLDAVIAEARDIPLARRVGIQIRQPVRAEVFTPRETQVLELLRSGLANRAIAQTLFVSEATVKVHLRHIYEKMGVRSRAEALARSFRQ